MFWLHPPCVLLLFLLLLLNMKDEVFQRLLSAMALVRVVFARFRIVVVDWFVVAKLVEGPALVHGNVTNNKH